MGLVAGGQVCSLDLERILCSEDVKNRGDKEGEAKTTGHSWLLHLATRSVAKALVQGRLQYQEKYVELCEHFPEFGELLEEEVRVLREKGGGGEGVLEDGK